MSGPNGPQRIVVGVDGSLDSHAALRWALDHARPGDTVHLVHAYRPPYVAGIDDGEGAEAAGRGLIGRELARARCVIGDRPIAVTGEAVRGAPGERLAEGAADLVVVGTGVRHPVVDTLIGSVCRHLLHHCPVPVVVVPDRRQGAGERS